MASIGMKLDAIPTEEVVALAPRIDAAGFEELWICEDLGRNGGIAQAGLALGATERCRVGLGIAPAAVRNVAYFAMEVASLCRAHPGRFIPGLGHGMPNWLREVGAHPGRLMPALEEVTVVSQRLVAGETVTFHGEYVQVEEVTLGYPAPEAPRMHLGVRGPRGIEMAGRVAGGVILAEGSGPDYVRGASERLAGTGARITVFAWFCVDDDGAAALDRVRPIVAAALSQDFMQSQVGALGAGEATDEVVRELTVAGTPAECAAAVGRLVEAGAEAVVLQPIAGTEAQQIEALGPPAALLATD
ncbi:MAG: LLM class flavin-dependent oxidoreductase [Actinobacteria bacterium]|nr:LLM class flavin-dependent oxidoreductase [Actinomycetota bacterium]